MTLMILMVIYLVFISLGLPDGVLGSAWPAIHQSLGVPIGWGGFISIIITSMTIISSLATASLVRRFGVGLLLMLSTGLTAVALLGFSQVQSIEWLLLLAIPLGLGAGAIDSALNNYVANHYDAHHMNWLHASWGVGAAIGPIIFAASLAQTGDWHDGYLSIGFIQAMIVVMLLLSLPLWRKIHQRRLANDTEVAEGRVVALLKERNVKYTFIVFLLYVGIEVGVGLWLASYLVQVQMLAIEVAALWSGFYYGAITAGRLLTGFISFRLTSEQLVRYGLVVALLGALLLVSHTAPIVSLVGVVLVGLGFAPIYPGLIHVTPKRFGRSKSAGVMSLQMVGGYVGASLIPPLIGLLSNSFSMIVFAYTLPLIVAGIFLGAEYMNRIFTRQ